MLRQDVAGSMGAARRRDLLNLRRPRVGVVPHHQPLEAARLSPLNWAEVGSALPIWRPT